jgi:hypothetical protein
MGSEAVDEALFIFPQPERALAAKPLCGYFIICLLVFGLLIGMNPGIPVTTLAVSQADKQRIVDKS